MKEKKKNRKEDSLADLWDNIKHANTLITGVPKRGETEKGLEKIINNIIAESYLRWKGKVDNAESQ